MDKVQKDELLKNEQINTVFNTVFSMLSTTDFTFNESEVEQMLQDIDIKSAIDQRKRGVNSRLLEVTGEGRFKDILQEQFNDLNKTDIIDVIIDSKFKGYTVQEIIYNDDYTMQKLKEKPNDWYIQEWNEELREYEWQLSYGSAVYDGANAGELLPFAKYLIPIYKPTDILINGRSDLEAVYKWWKIKNNALEYSNSIVEKYGGVITWWLYNSEGTSEAELLQMINGMTNLTNGSQIPIPYRTGDGDRGLNKDFGFVTMNDLKIDDIHLKLVEFCKQQISEYLIGSSITMTAGKSGSYSSGNVGYELLQSTIESDVAYVEYWLDWLVYYQSVIFGFNHKDYQVKLNEKPDLNAIQDLNKKKIENYNGVKALGYQVSAEYISQETGIPIEALSELPQQPVIEFAEKKKTLDDIKEVDRKTDEELQKAMQIKSTKVTGQLAKLYNEAYSKIKTANDINGVSVDWTKSEIDEDFLIYELFGRYSQRYRDVLEFEEELTIESIFKLPFEEAINYFLGKMPELAENIDELTQEAAQKTFWLKKSTDIEVTQKVKAALDKSLELGGTFRQFKEDISDVLAKAGIDKNGYYLENVYRTNMMTSYGAGRLEQQEETKEQYPYWLYNAIEDDRTSEICSELNDKIYRSDNPIWNSIYCPNHFGCRSVVTPLDKEQMEDLGLKVNRPNKATEETVKKIAKGGFKGKPTNQLKKLQEIAEKKEAEWIKE